MFRRPLRTVLVGVMGGGHPSILSRQQSTKTKRNGLGGRQLFVTLLPSLQGSAAGCAALSSSSQASGLCSRRAATPSTTRRGKGCTTPLHPPLRQQTLRSRRSSGQRTGCAQTLSWSWWHARWQQGASAQQCPAPFNDDNTMVSIVWVLYMLARKVVCSIGISRMQHVHTH